MVSRRLVERSLVVLVGLLLAASDALADHRITRAARREEIATSSTRRRPVDLRIPPSTAARHAARPSAPAHPMFEVADLTSERTTVERPPRTSWRVKPMMRFTAQPRPHPLVPADRRGANTGDATIKGATVAFRF